MERRQLRGWKEVPQQQQKLLHWGTRPFRRALPKVWAFHHWNTGIAARKAAIWKVEGWEKQPAYMAHSYSAGCGRCHSAEPYVAAVSFRAGMLMYGREAQSKTRIASPATIPKSGERNRKIHSCMLYLISIWTYQADTAISLLAVNARLPIVRTKQE